MIFIPRGLPNEIVLVTKFNFIGGMQLNRNLLNNDNKYLYNGKEMQDDLFANGSKLDWLDYGARMYDGASARFMTQDPLAEDYYSLSPYGYVAGNPIACRDENGEWINFIVGAVVGAVTDYAVQVAGNVIENGWSADAFTDVDGGSILTSAGSGAMGVGIASGFNKLSKISKIVKVASKSKTHSKIEVVQLMLLVMLLQVLLVL